MSDKTQGVLGSCAPEFAMVRQLFSTHLGELGLGGAAFAVMVDGELVVDLWAGQAGGSPWRRSTRGVLHSATKGIAAIVVARLVDAGLLDVDAPVATYWPEFAAAGKAEVTVAHVLTHTAGLVGVPGYENFLGPYGEGWDNRGEILRRLEAATPEWPPGSAHAYHALTFGWLIGELVERAAGVSAGALVRQELAGPLDLELDLGTPPEQQHLVAPQIPPTTRLADALPEQAELLSDPSSLLSRMLFAADGNSAKNSYDRLYNKRSFLAVEMPACNATGTARAIAILYGILAKGGSHNGVEVLTPETIRTFAKQQQHGRDLALGTEQRWALGFQRPVPPPGGHPQIWGPHDEAFGHRGGGGQIGFADPVSKVGFGFLRSHASWDSPLAALLVEGTYECLRAKEA